MSDTIPRDVQALIDDAVDAQELRLIAIGNEIAERRDEAKRYRASSGIETTWEACEDAYAGIDDANRGTVSAPKRWYKPTSMDGPVTTKATSDSDGKSTIFHRLTARYVDAGVAKLSEILIPIDDKAFSFDCTPVPEQVEAKDDESPVVSSELGVTLTRPVQPGEQPAPPAVGQPAALSGMVPPTAAPEALGQAPVPPGAGLGGAAVPPVGLNPAGGAPTDPTRTPIKVKDLATEAIEMARKKAKKAETRIYDWMVETGFRPEMRKVIFDAAKLGVGVLKGPVPSEKKMMSVVQENERPRVLRKQKIIPMSRWIDPWNLFPDPACGENIQEGDYILERDYLSAKAVRELKRLPGYIGSQIDKVLKEGPQKAYVNGRDGSDKRYEIWYYYGQLAKEDISVLDRAAKVESMDLHDEEYCIVTMINDSVVRSAFNPLDSGAFPYHAMPWQRRENHWAGIGVAEQIREPQRMVNAALRAMLNNAGKSAGSQWFIDQRAFRPMDGEWTVTPDKFWQMKTDAPYDDIRKAFAVVQIPNVTQQMLELITLAERHAEEISSIPLIAQGQSGATTPDTFGAAQLQNNNANQLLRSIGYSFDDHITEPVVRQYYEWLLLDPNVPDEEKGDYQIDAHGSPALVERAIQDQTIGQMGAMAANPIYKVNPSKWAVEFLKSKKLNPNNFTYTEEEQEKIDAQPPPEDPRIAVAKINADVEMKKLVAAQQADQQTVQHEQQIAAAAQVLKVAQARTAETQVHGDLTLRARQLEVEHERAQAQELNDLKIALDQAKTQLAETVMKLQTEQRLNEQNHAHEMRKHTTPEPPPVQAPGRADDGQAFSQA